ncbi:MAG: C40 family peptidase [Jatrophihabitans sp.]
MAIRLPRHALPVIVVTALVAGALIGPTTASAAPHRQPSIDSVQKQLGELALQNSQLVENFDHARVMVATREKQAAAALQVQRRIEVAYRGANAEFAQNVQAQYESGAMGAAGALLDSNSGGNYLDRLTGMNLVSSHDADVVGRVSIARKEASDQASRTATLLGQAQQERTDVAAKKVAVEQQITKYQRLLSTLNSAQQAAYLRASNPMVASATALKNLPGTGSKAAQRAVRFALAQVGLPYVFGAAGPSAFDCSGLTMAAWHAGGVSLPHSAADQYNYGHHVNIEAMQPGDLVFLYSPIGHVTIYIGDGLMVSAPTEGQNVSVVPVSAFRSDIVGATHLA